MPNQGPHSDVLSFFLSSVQNFSTCWKDNIRVAKTNYWVHVKVSYNIPVGLYARSLLTVETIVLYYCHGGRGAGGCGIGIIKIPWHPSH